MQSIYMLLSYLPPCSHTKSCEPMCVHLQHSSTQTSHISSAQWSHVAGGYRTAGISKASPSSADENLKQNSNLASL